MDLDHVPIMATMTSDVAFHSWPCDVMSRIRSSRDKDSAGNTSPSYEKTIRQSDLLSQRSSPLLRFALCIVDGSLPLGEAR